MSTWIKVGSAYFSEPSMVKLRRELRRDADTLPLKLWLFAAGQDGTGDLSDYTHEELAEALNYRGDASRMVKALQSSGYLTPEMQVADWEDIFGLCKSRQQAGRTRALKRWGKTNESPSTPPPVQEETTQEERRGESHALPDALPDAAPPHSGWPANLPADELQRFAEETEKPKAAIAEAWTRYRGKKLRFKDSFALEGFEGFGDYLRSKEGAKCLASFVSKARWDAASNSSPSTTNATLAEPEYWREACAWRYSDPVFLDPTHPAYARTYHDLSAEHRSYVDIALADWSREQKGRPADAAPLQ